ncbi:hypothetical protein FGE12_20555 [Aggregicoccus sp. 17bor-14]|uniref:hypothetical protein n=1 Tax=Myxococcaceae TaxID=31 RepID=UPI0012F29C33|nr:MULTISPECIES: hypothetical protein [Myxococcaceae]MBF5044802.1 hypothetical protein [Simulacricoccus sp. 17bor-14]MRI90546.1 hypothetical protein [Aggregicoccus sp. 17bor-14]
MKSVAVSERDVAGSLSRGFLYGSLPFVFLMGGVLAWILLEHQPAPLGSGEPFTISDVDYSVPLSTRLLGLSAFVCALVQAVLCFRWGSSGRRAPRLTLVLAAMPWALGSLHMGWGWEHQVLALMFAAGTGGIATLAAGVSELLAVQAAAAGATAALLGSLLAVVALDAWRFRAAPPPRWTPAGVLLPLALLVAWVSVASETLASRAGVEFFSSIAETGLDSWKASMDTDARSWAWLQMLQLGAAAAAPLALLLLGRKGIAVRGSHGSRSLAWGAVLLAALQVLHVLEVRRVLSQVVTFVQAGGATEPPAALWTGATPAGDALDDGGLRPSLSLGADGVSLPGTPRVRWEASGRGADEALSRYRQELAVALAGPPVPPTSLSVALEPDATLSSLLCLAGAARRLGVGAVELASGPEQPVSPATRQALAHVSPALGSAFSSLVRTHPALSLQAGCRDSHAEHKASLTLSPTSPPDEAALKRARPFSGWRCVALNVSGSATISDLLRVLDDLGEDSELALAPESEAQCQAKDAH